MEANQLPTKPGPYYWREKDGDKWKLGNVFEHYDKRFHFETFNIGGKPVVDLQGQWLPIPTAEELVELQAKAKAYDEGETQSAVYNGKDEFMWSDSFLNMREKSGLPIGHTCRKVRVCKEVEG